MVMFMLLIGSRFILYFLVSFIIFQHFSSFCSILQMFLSNITQLKLIFFITIPLLKTIPYQNNAMDISCFQNNFYIQMMTISQDTPCVSGSYMKHNYMSFNKLYNLGGRPFGYHNKFVNIAQIVQFFIEVLLW